MRRFKTAVLGARLAVLGVGLLAMVLVTPLASTRSLPGTVLGWAVSLSNPTFERVDPSDQLFAKFDVSVKPFTQSDGYKLEQVEVQAELWKFRTGTTSDGVTLTDKVRLLYSDEYFFSVVGTPTFSASGATLLVTKSICGYIGRELDPESRWRLLEEPGPADGFVVVFRLDVQGTKEGVPVFGSAAFTVPLDHQVLCSD